MYGVVFFFKQKTAYDMRISDWSSDVCSSDLAARAYALSPANPFVVETHVKSLLERAGEGSEEAPALCVEALNVLFAASDSKEVQYRRDQLAKMADNALEILFQQPRSLNGSATRSDRKSTRLNSSH